MMTSIYTLTIFTSAFLLFLIQPMISKLLLPHLGGSPAVWNTSMMFFQTLLLGGYLYAHIGGKWLGTKKQVILHFILLIFALAWLPVAVRTDIGFASVEHPISWVIVSLFLSVGFPFFVLAANAPMIQSWMANTTHKDAKDPYFLYSASNVGSMLALFGYPFLIEPALTLSGQTKGWSMLFVVFVGLIALCAFYLKQNFSPITAPSAQAQASDRPPTTKDKIHWVALAFFPSSLLLGVTTFITTDIASMPLFWVIPLAIYLLTFIFAFAKKPIMIDRALNAQIVLVPLTVLALVFKINFISQVMLLHLFTFFAMAMGCHGVLARSKPGARHLTEFFVWISFGGMLGGIFNSLVAPNIFTEPVEYPLILILTLLMRPLIGAFSNPDRERRLDYLVPLAFTALLIGGFYVFNTAFSDEALRSINLAVAKAYSLESSFFSSPIIPLMGVALYLFIMGAVIISYKRPIRFALIALALMLVIPLAGSAGKKETPVGNLVYAERNFFGVNRVFKWIPLNAMLLMHGTTVHGIQGLAPEDRLQPVSYYGPLRDVFEYVMPAVKDKPFAVLGLGAGTLACLGHKGQTADFYEIDPVVVAIAENPEYFTYLKECGIKPNIFLGDGRLVLAKAEEKRYGIMVMDAFSSDAIPLHLLTRESLAMYVSKLADGGVIAFNISNRHLHLTRVMATLAHDAGLTAITLRNMKPGHKLGMASEWVVMARSLKDFRGLEKHDSRWKVMEASVSGQVWTDNYSNIFEPLFQ